MLSFILTLRILKFDVQNWERGVGEQGGEGEGGAWPKAR